MELGVVVPYVIIKTNGTHRDIMVTLNQKQRNWSQRDYIQYYAGLGKKNYEELENFIEDNLGGNIKMNLLINIFSSAKGSGLKTGNLPKRECDKDLFLQQWKDYADIFPFCFHGPFVDAIIKVFSSPRYKHFEHFNKIKRLRHEFYQCAKATQYLNLITEILNKGVSKNHFYL